MIPRLLRSLPTCSITGPIPGSSRPLATTIAQLAKSLPPRPKPPPDSEIEESFLKGSGPGGQKINKTNSAVQLKHIPTGIVVKSQATRSRDQNRKEARKLLAQRLDELHNGDRSRTAIVGDIKRKKAASADKKKRRKYRLLEEEKVPASAAEKSESPVQAQTADESKTPQSVRPGSENKEVDGVSNRTSK